MLNVPGAYCDLQTAPRVGGAPVILCVTETGGYSSSGGERARADELPSKAIVATDVMWEFSAGCEGSGSHSRAGRPPALLFEPNQWQELILQHLELT